MMKTVLSVLALSVLALGVATTGADAKSKKKMKAAAAPAGCSAPAGMRDESRFHSCYMMPMKK